MRECGSAGVRECGSAGEASAFFFTYYELRFAGRQTRREASAYALRRDK